MLRHNLFACVRDTSEGVRKPRSSAAARSGPYPLREPAGPTDDGPPRRPSSNVIGTANTPVFVYSGKLKEAGSGASARGGTPTPSTKRGFSGRKIIRHGESNEYEHGELPLSEGMEVGADDIPGSVRSAGGVGSSGKFAFDRLKSRRPVESDVPERRGVDPLGSGGGSFFSMAFWDSARHFGDEPPDGERVDGSSVKHTRGLPRLPWGERGLAEVDIPRRRSVDTSGHMGVASESEVPDADSDSHLPHLLDGSKGKQRLGAALSRFPVGFRNNPTESSLPRRRSSHAPDWNLSGEGSGGSPDTSTREGEHQDSSSPDGGNVGDVATGKGGDLAGLDVSAGHTISKGGGVGGWAVKSRAPVVVDLPRRRSGYSVDSSAQSMHDASVAAGSLQQVVADNSRAKGNESVGDERGAPNGSGIQGSSVLAELAGLNRGPAESGLPRRRRSSDISLPEGGVVLPMDDVSSRGGDGTSGVVVNNDQAVSESSASASRRLSCRVSARGGWRSGLNSRTPVVVDLPRRSSGYSFDGSGRSVGGLDVSGGESFRLQQGARAGDGDTEDTKSDADAGLSSARLGSGGVPSVSADRRSVFPALAGQKRAPIESDLPRRRPSKYLTAEGASTAGDTVQNSEAGVDVSESQGVGMSRSGKGGAW